MAGSTLLGRSLNNLEGQDFGFEIPDRVLVAIGRPPADYAPERLTALYRDVEARLARLPGVRGAGLALYNPLTDNWGEGCLWLASRRRRRDRQQGVVGSGSRRLPPAARRETRARPPLHNR